MTFWAHIWNRLKAVPVGVWAALAVAMSILGLYLRGRRLEAELGRRLLADTERLELLDCESGESRTEDISSATRTRYLDAYRRHFELWSAMCRQRNIALAVLPTGLDFEQALLRHALPQGAVEPWS